MPFCIILFAIAPPQKTNKKKQKQKLLVSSKAGALNN